MGFSLKRALKKLERGTRGIRKAAGMAALGAATGGLGMAAAAAAKNVGQNVRQRIKSKATRAMIGRTAAMAGPKPNGAETMPGGAPLRRAKKKRPTGAYVPHGAKARARSIRQQVAKNRAAKRPKKLRVEKVAKVRRAPSGGLDLKALSAKWKAAGKPGRWIDFVKANG